MNHTNLSWCRGGPRPVVIYGEHLTLTTAATAKLTSRNNLVSRLELVQHGWLCMCASNSTMAFCC